MRRFLLCALGAALLATPVAGLPAASRVVGVTFASVAALRAKNGERIRPDLFSFGAGARGRSKSARGTTNGFGRSKTAACRWALLRAFLALQRDALRDGLRVVGVRTFAGRHMSADPNQCLCLAGAVIVRTDVRGVLH